MRFLFLSYHHYRYSRSGGMIELAKALRLSGENVTFLFAGFPLVRRPFTKDNRYDYRWICSVFSVREDDLGVRFGIWLSFGLWSLLHYKIIKLLNKHVILNDWIVRPLLKEADVLVVESCFGVMYIEKILSINPDIRVLYRPSDPMNLWCSNEFILDSERLVISNARAVLVKNKTDYDYYVSLGCRDVVTVPNYISIDITHKTSDRSSLLNLEIWNKKVALYVGAMMICWETVFTLASRFDDWNYVVIIPIVPPRDVLERLENTRNVFWFNGVDRSAVGSLIERCDLFLVPYISGYYEKYKWGLSAKYLMAMYYRKGILAINEDPELAEFGITVCNEESELLDKFYELTLKTEFTYECELVYGTWLMNADRVISSLKSK